MTLPLDLDRLAAAAFPAAEEERAGGWLLRASPGEQPRRLNSALPIGSPLDVDVVAGWYAERGLPPLVLVSPEEDHAALDGELDARGWAAEAFTQILVGDPGEVLERLEGPAHPVVPTDLDGPPATLRSRDPVLHLGAAGGAGRASLVLQDDFALVLALEVDPARRREGIGAALVRACARASEGRTLYLQVFRDNEAANRLYGSAGFTASHGYHYRRAPAGTGRA